VSIKSQNKTPEKTKCGDLAKLMTPSMAPPRSAETSKYIRQTTYFNKFVGFRVFFHFDGEFIFFEGSPGLKIQDRQSANAHNLMGFG